MRNGKCLGQDAMLQELESCVCCIKADQSDLSLLAKLARSSLLVGGQVTLVVLQCYTTLVQALVATVLSAKEDFSGFLHFSSNAKFISCGHANFFSYCHCFLLVVVVASCPTAASELWKNEFQRNRNNQLKLKTENINKCSIAPE